MNAIVVLQPPPPTIAELVEVFIDSLALQGANNRQLTEERLRLQRDAAYFDEWVLRIHEWHSDPLAHLQEMRNSGYMDYLLGPDLEIE